MKHLIFFISLLTCGQAFSQEILWERRWRGEGSVYSVNVLIKEATEGLFTVGGSSSKNFAFPAHAAQYDQDGVQLWRKPGHILYTGEQDIVPLPSGGYIFTASERNTGTVPTTPRLILQRLSETGDTLWTKRVGPLPGGAIPTSMLLNVDGGYTIFSYSLKPDWTQDYLLLRTDSEGSLLWYRTFGPWGNNYSGHMIRNFRGNLVLAGSSQGPQVHFQPYLLEISTNGDSLKGKAVVVKSNDMLEYYNRMFNNIIETSDGAYVFSGDRIDSADYSLGFIAKVDTSFNLLWSHIHRPRNTRKARVSKVQELADGSLAYMAHDEHFPTRQFQVGRLSADGLLLSRQTYSSTACSRVMLYDWQLLEDGSAVVVGRCDDDAYIARITGAGRPATVTGLPEVPPPPRPRLGQAYPNPARTEATVAYSLPAGSTEGTLTLHSLVKGERLREYRLQGGPAEGTLTLDLSGIASGVYLYTLTVDGKPVERKRMVVIK